MSINEIIGEEMLYETLLDYSFDESGYRARVVDAEVLSKMEVGLRFLTGNHNRFFPLVRDGT